MIPVKKIALILAVALALSSCGGPSSEETSSEASSSEASSSEASSSEASSASSEEAASEATSSQDTVSEESNSSDTSQEAAAQEAAAQQAAQEAAAQQAAQEAAAQEAAAQEAAAQEAAAQQAAQEAAAQQAAQEAAAQQAAQEAAAQEEASSQSPKTTVNVSGANFLSRVERELLDLHNEVRAERGLGALTLNEDLQTAARIRAKELCQLYQRTGKEIAHERPNGDTWSTVLREDVPVEYAAAGENLCSVVYQKEYIDQEGEDPGRESDWWMEQWLGSSTHREVLTNSRYDQVGFGVYYIKRDGMIYAFAAALFIESK